MVKEMKTKKFGNENHGKYFELKTKKFRTENHGEYLERVGKSRQKNWTII